MLNRQRSKPFCHTRTPKTNRCPRTRRQRPENQNQHAPASCRATAFSKNPRTSRMPIAVRQRNRPLGTDFDGLCNDFAPIGANGPAREREATQEQSVCAGGSNARTGFHRLQVAQTVKIGTGPCFSYTSTGADSLEHQELDGTDGLPPASVARVRATHRQPHPCALRNRAISSPWPWRSVGVSR